METKKYPTILNKMFWKVSLLKMEGNQVLLKQMYIIAKINVN